MADFCSAVDSWISSLENHVFPLIGSKPVNEVDSPAVVEVLSPIWLEIPDTARRILQRIGAVLDFAHIKGWLPDELAATISAVSVTSSSLALLVSALSICSPLMVGIGYIVASELKSPCVDH
ncbi:phage integrase central domain-containing protein [Sphingobium cupriresistens]|uniref:phage integrase central domain-containing protein n=1 Tax=Sphingobium cupriresistens TaxID=1132417 RepID=UPI003BF57F52